MTPPDTTSTQWNEELDTRMTRLLTEGAELSVSHPDGTSAFRAALGRCHRVDADSGAVWILPLVGGYRPARPEPGGEYAFDLEITRRRNLTFHRVHVDEHDRLVFELINDQTAVVQPAGADLVGRLRRWDTYYATLPADIQTALDTLTADTL